MATPVLERRGFAAAVFDALAAHICVVDSKGVIVAVNRAWSQFSNDNPPSAGRTGLGMHYLEICRDASGPGSEEAAAFGSGISRVLSGRAKYFELEYPCHSPAEDRWFLGSVTPLGGRWRGAVIAHTAITDRKKLELELARMAATDALTGLPNRRYFETAGESEIARVTRFGGAASVVMIDIDHFKSVNDRHGHASGDEALRRVAQTCRGLLRQIDVFARIGGEEFAVLLPGTDAWRAVRVAEKLRKAVAAPPLKGGEPAPVAITASFGVAAVRRGDTGIAVPLARADKALYDAKRAGRNLVRRFAEEAPQPKPGGSPPT